MKFIIEHTQIKPHPEGQFESYDLALAALIKTQEETLAKLKKEQKKRSNQPDPIIVMISCM